MSTPSAKTLVIRHEACSSLGLLGPVAQRQQGIHYLNPFEGEVLTVPITDYSHLIMLGGAISAYDDDRYPFLRYEFELIEMAIAHGIPTIGICLGAQILAKVLGAKVYRGKAGREAGWCMVKLLEASGSDPLFQQFPPQFRVFQSHQDTFDIPTGAVRLAASAQYPNQAFRYGDRVWALQFHLEFDEKVLADCSSVIAQELHDSGIQTTTLAQLIEEATRCSAAVAPLADRAMQQFFQLTSSSAVTSA